jgi:hypothetical protein
MSDPAQTEAPARAPAPAPRVARAGGARKLLLGGIAATALGLIIAGTVPYDEDVRSQGSDVPINERRGTRQALGGVLVVMGWLTLVLGLHRFGRTGSDDAPPAAPSVSSAPSE